MISIGDKPQLDFSVNVLSSGEQKNVAFQDLIKSPAVVSVYMKNNTGSCDKQTASLAEHAGWFAKKGYSLIAVSKDSCGSHAKYAARQGINYTLVSDPDHLFSKAVDSIVEKKMYGKTYFGPARAAFIFDENGIIKAVVEKVDSARHAEQLQEIIESL